MNSPTEARLRRTLAARADAVEPTPEATDFAAVKARTTDVRRATARRHTTLAVAAAVLLVVGVAGVLTIGGQGDDRADVATGPTTPTTETRDTSGRSDIANANPETTAIWPLPSMSIAYGNPIDAALAFAQGYLGFTEPLCTKAPVEDPSGEVVVGVVHQGVCNGGLTNANADEPFGPTTEVHVRRGNYGWEVFASGSSEFVVTDQSGQLDIQVLVDTLPAALTVEVRPLGELTPISAQTVAPPTAPNDTVAATVDAPPDGAPVVVIVSDGVTASTGIHAPPEQ